MPGGAVNQFSVDLGSEYDPTDVQASNQLFAVDSGSLVTGDPTDLQPVTGPLGSLRGHRVGRRRPRREAGGRGHRRRHDAVMAPVTAVGTERRRSRR